MNRLRLSWKNTDLYEAPEVLRAEVGLESVEWLGPSDVWSLGCIVTRILTLEPLYASAVSRDNQQGMPASVAGSMLHQTLPRIATGEIQPTDNLEDAFHPWKPDELAVPPHAAKLIRWCTEPDQDNRPTAAAVFESIGAGMQHELHHPKKVAQPPATDLRQVAAHSLPAPSASLACGRRVSIEVALERSSVHEALGIPVDEDSEVVAPSPHRALVADDSGNSSDPEEVYLALAQTPEARNAGRAVATRLASRKRGSMLGHSPRFSMTMSSLARACTRS